MTNPLRLFNSLTRELETFSPVHEGEARVYSCGPTVYNYPHIGNMRAYVFADVLGRTLSWKGYKLTHVINITDVGHLTDDADAGEDKLEKAAAQSASDGNKQSIWDIAEHYKQAYWSDVRALNIRQPAQWTVATDYVPQMIAFAEGIAKKHCYQLDSGLYFDVSTVADYGKLASQDELLHQSFKIAVSLKAFADKGAYNPNSMEELRGIVSNLRDWFQRSLSRTPNNFRLRNAVSTIEALEEVVATGPADHVVKLFRQSSEVIEDLVNQGRIEQVPGKRHAADFAIWRTTPSDETRQMEWDSPWGRGAPGWHLECSVMSGAVLGFPFDIHTGGIDHREIHHPNEIAQNQAHCCTNGLDDAANSGAKIWMHNNFLVERSGKMSKSAGEFLRLQLLIDKGYHPLAYRLMCLQAHYRSELEFSWEGLAAASRRLQRLVIAIRKIRPDNSYLAALKRSFHGEKPASWEVIEDARQDASPRLQHLLTRFDQAISDDLNTAEAIVVLEDLVKSKGFTKRSKMRGIALMDEVLGLGLINLSRRIVRLPADRVATPIPLVNADIDAAIRVRRKLKEAGRYDLSDGLRQALAEWGVEVMDGDPLGWEWKL